MKFIFSLLLLQSIVLHAQKLQSPEEFLGYKPGTHFTPHFKILDYFKSVAAARPDMIKLEKYGSTYEGRDLMLCYIALPENLQKLDSIRINNLRLAGVANDNIPGVENNAPAILWLSYNVHGNEPASSEASMMMLYALADPGNPQTKEWLKNTVVIIDPCLNPDGRERYVSWYNTAVGDTMDVNPAAREHHEPWPYGRTNHYNFDLNRDWAWQTQKESKARLVKYNEWLPEVHVDYHEQGPNAPYYFAPAAEPYHEVITQWQRDFQVQVGKNNARYFDQNGWLYFTRQEFDLFYPSYGDTYPIYNGSIGMTYEQGGIGAGLGIKLEDGDTLTLVDRVAHHFTTGLATLEVTSKNSEQLVTEFKKYFDQSAGAEGAENKTYLLTSNDANKLNEVAELLKQNGIQFGTPSSTSFRGYNYLTGKTENYAAQKYQLAISAFQPKSRLVRVLFEPDSYLSDSATYDISAWSIPYVYGIEAYAVKEKINIESYKGSPPVQPVQSDYGLLIPYTSLNAAKALSFLLKNKVKVRYSEKPFAYKDKNYDRGTLIILKGNNVAEWNKITNEACRQFNIQADSVESGFVEKGSDFGSSYIRFIKAPKVAMITGAGIYQDAAGEVWSFFDQTLHYPVTQLFASSLNDSRLNDYDVLILPDGNYDFLNNKSSSDKIQNFVNNGGKLIALQGSGSQIAQMDWAFKIKKINDEDSSATASNYAALKSYADREKDYLHESIPGAIYKVDLDSTHPLAFGYPGYYYTLKQDDRLFDFLKDGWNIGVLKQSNYVSGFVGSKVKPELKDGLLFGEVDYGRGSIILLADDVLFRLFWKNGELLFSNAVFLTGQ